MISFKALVFCFVVTFAVQSVMSDDNWIGGSGGAGNGGIWGGWGGGGGGKGDGVPKGPGDWDDDKGKDDDECQPELKCVLCDVFYHIQPNAGYKELKNEKEYKFCQVIQRGVIDVKGNLNKKCIISFLLNAGLSKKKIAKVLKECDEDDWKKGSPQDIGAAHYDCVWKISTEDDDKKKDY